MSEQNTEKLFLAYILMIIILAMLLPQIFCIGNAGVFNNYYFPFMYTTVALAGIIFGEQKLKYALKNMFLTGILVGSVGCVIFSVLETLNRQYFTIEMESEAWTGLGFILVAMFIMTSVGIGVIIWWLKKTVIKLLCKV